MTELFLFSQFLAQHSIQSRCLVQFTELIDFIWLLVHLWMCFEKGEAVHLLSCSLQTYWECNCGEIVHYSTHTT